MSYDVIDGLLIFLIYMGLFMLLCCVVGFLADYVVPRVPFLNRWVERLIGDDDFDDEE